MKFIVDEQLPKKLSDWLVEKGYDSIHIDTLNTLNSVMDEEICLISMAELRIVITKDSDFWDTYLVKQQPYKLLYITTGNITNKELIQLFDLHLGTILVHLFNNNVIELNRNEIKIHF